MSKRRTNIEFDIQERQEKLEWQEAAEQFMNSLKLKGLAYHTRRWHKENLQSVFKTLREKGLSTDPAMISEAMLREVFISMADRNLSPTTINHRVRSMKQFYAFLVKEAFVASNPTISLEKQKVRKNIVEAFTEDQVVTLLSMPEKSRFSGLRDYTIMLLLLDTGIRLSELCNIRLIDLRTSQNELIVKEGKGGVSKGGFSTLKKPRRRSQST